MKVGMLWHDADPKRTAADKVTRACDYYRNKYGANPTVCYVNPILRLSLPDMVGRVKIEQARNVLTSHFWVGQEE